jgi:hypothetical protein
MPDRRWPTFRLWCPAAGTEAGSSALAAAAEFLIPAGPA